MGQRFGLSKKILLGCIIFIFIPICLLGMRFYSNATQLLERQLVNSNLETVKHFDQYYLNVVNDNLKLFLNIWSDKTDLSEVFDSKTLKEKYEAQWTHALLGYPEIDSIYYGSINGQMFQIPDRPLPKGYDPRLRPWYLDGAAGGGKLVWSKPFKSLDTNESIFTVSTQIKNRKGEPTGVLSIAVDLKEMSSLMEEVKYGANGYMMLVDQEGRIVATRDTRALNRNISQDLWAKNILAKEEGSFSYVLDGKAVIISFVTNARTGWKLVGIMPKSDLMPKIVIFKALMQKIFTTLAVWGFVLIMAVLLMANGFVVRPIKKLMLAMEKAKEGDMTVVHDMTHFGHDEIGQLYKAFEHMIQGQRDMLVQVLVNATKLKGLSDETQNVANKSMETARSQSHVMINMSQSVEDMSQSIQEVTGNMNNVSKNLESFTVAMQEIGFSSSDIAKSTVDTNEAIVDVVTSIANLEVAIGQILEITNQIVQKGSTAVDSVFEGKTVVDYAVAEMDEVQSSMAGLSLVIENLAESVTQVGEITRVINDLSVQTNLLSLNASIEAARAGEHGTGFAVVATAIGQLAEKSKVSTKNVDKIIGQIRLDMADAADFTSKSVEQISKGRAHVNGTKPAFESVLSEIGEAIDLIEQMNVATSEQWQASKTIQEAATKVSRLTKQVSEASDNQQSTLEELIVTTEMLNTLTKDVTSSGMVQAANSEELASTGQNLTEMTLDGMRSSEKVDAIATHLNGQASDLVEMVSKFKL